MPVAAMASISPSLEQVADSDLSAGAVSIWRTGFSSGSTLGLPCEPAWFKRALHPVDLREIDAVFVLQHAADEDRGGLGVERHADALALEILGRLDAGFLVDRDVAVAEDARGEDRDRDERAVALGVALKRLGARHLRRVEFLAAAHAVENLARAVDGDEIEVDALRPAPRRCRAAPCGHRGRRRR